MKQDKLSAPPAATWIVNTGLLAIAVATLLPILRLGVPWFRYLYAAGALLTLVGRIITVRIYNGAPLRVRRLGRMEFWAAVVFAVGTFFLFWPGAGPTDWLAFTLAGAALQTYASIMLPRIITREIN